MNQVHRYKVVTMLSAAGATIGYDPHGPEIVLAADFDRVTAERDALQQRLTAADERADGLETEVARLNRVKLALKELVEIHAGNLSVYRYYLSETLAMAEKVRDASLGMQRKYLADLIDNLHQYGAALKPAEPATDEHVCTGCGSKGWTANCKECVPY